MKKHLWFIELLGGPKKRSKWNFQEWLLTSHCKVAALAHIGKLWNQEAAATAVVSGPKEIQP